MKRVRSFGGVGAWRVSSNSAVFLRSRDRGSEDAVIFSETGDDGYFDQTGLHEIGLVSRVCKIPVVRS